MAGESMRDNGRRSCAQAGLIIAGKYELLDLIGEGGMGTVWAATHLGLNQTVALKIISPTYANSEEARSRFDHEAKAAARLKSRYVVQVFDNGELDDGTPYMAMELLEGESLAARLTRGPVTVPEAATWVSQIAKALDRAHALGIIHRDIKPENIFLAHSHDDESGVVVKVLDFGIAKIAALDGEASHTRTGVIMGTPLFMSPEQARGLKSLDHRSDLYSVALVVYRMLTGRNPFGGESLVDLVVQICTQPLPSFQASGPALPLALDPWLQKAANRDPAQRFSTAREMAEAFAVASDSREEAAPSTLVAASPSYVMRGRSDSWLDPNDPASQLGATLASSGSGVTGVFEGAARTHEDIPVPRSPWALRAGLGLAVAAVAAVAVTMFLHAPARAVATQARAPVAMNGLAQGPTGDNEAPVMTAAASPGVQSASSLPQPDIEPSPPSTSTAPTAGAPTRTLPASRDTRTNKGARPVSRPPSSATPATPKPADSSGNVDVGF